MPKGKQYAKSELSGQKNSKMPEVQQFKINSKNAVIDQKKIDK